MSIDDQITIFVLGLDEKNLAVLQDVPEARHYRFLPLLSKPQLQYGEIPIADLLEEAQQKLDCFESRIDAIVGYWDFPISVMVPILCRRRGLRSAPLDAVIRCEHKYWSRIEQQKVIEEIPRFGLVDLDAAPRVPEGLRYPLWLKPVKSASSELAFHVRDDAEFDSAVAAIREGVGRIGSPFDYVLTQIDLPPEVAAVGGQACLAEEEMSGVQVATEGYVFEGRIEVYGVLDSIDYPDSHCFLRHQYPSQLPPQVQQRLREISPRVIAQMGLDNSTFSIEFFYDHDTDRITLLEINPRHSQAHAELFKNVDGFPNHHVMLSLRSAMIPGCPANRDHTRSPPGATTVASGTGWCAGYRPQRRSTACSVRSPAWRFVRSRARVSGSPTSRSRTATAMNSPIS
jgi:hypothetical protein